MRRRLLAAGGVALLAACAAAPPPESVAVLPPLPQASDLVEFEVGAAGGFRYFVDAASLSVAPDGVVRYTVVARSADAVENVVHEAMRCASGDYRVHAVGRGKRWAGRETPWRPIAGARVQRWRSALQGEYFCPQNQPIRSAGEGVRALREGGHPFAKGFGR